jgi:hypothetical protein
MTPSAASDKSDSQTKYEFMAKITFIGAGSLVFTHNLCNDMLLAPALQIARVERPRERVFSLFSKDCENGGRRVST